MTKKASSKNPDIKLIAGLVLVFPLLVLGFLAFSGLVVFIKALLVLAAYLAGFSAIVYLAYIIISFLHKLFKFVCITDTTWWLEEGYQIKKFSTSKENLYIPALVVRELVRLKKDPEIGEKAAQIIQTIAHLIKAEKAKIVSLKRLPSYETLDSEAAREVMAVAENLKREGKIAIILSANPDILALARKLGITVWRSDKRSSSGYRHRFGKNGFEKISSSNFGSTGISVNGAVGPGDDGFWDSTWG